MLMLDRPAIEVLHTPLTLAEFLALPEDTRREIVDGILRPMAISSDLHREVQKYLTWRLTEQRPRELRASWELSVIFQIVPPTAYVPDALVYTGGSSSSRIEIHTHRLVEARYEPAAIFGRGARLTDDALPWLDIEVDTLLGDFA